MIRAIIFDLDGTLVQTEKLKALSYAKAAVQLRPDELSEDQVIDEFKNVVGLSRRDVAQKLMKKFDLKKAAEKEMDRYEVNKPWQAYVQIRLKYYNDMLSEPETLKQHLCPHNAALLDWTLRRKYRTALATMSHCRQARKILKLLNLHQKFEFIATRDDVEQGKPDPEIFELVSKELNISPALSLVIEDSTAGIEAALKAGMWCISSPNEFTRDQVHESQLLEKKWIVDKPENLQSVVEQFLKMMENA